jgi:hypothetical protein
MIQILIKIPIWFLWSHYIALQNGMFIQSYITYYTVHDKSCELKSSHTLLTTLCMTSHANLKVQLYTTYHSVHDKSCELKSSHTLLTTVYMTSHANLKAVIHYLPQCTWQIMWIEHVLIQGLTQLSLQRRARKKSFILPQEIQNPFKKEKYWHTEIPGHKIYTKLNGSIC